MLQVTEKVGICSMAFTGFMKGHFGEGEVIFH
jgi:hypothetical protein